MTDTEIKRDGQASEILLGNLGAQVRLVGYSGAKRSPIGGATLSTGNRTLIVQQTAGSHMGVLLGGTSSTATPSTSNSVLLVDDAAVSVATGKDLRLYNAAGTAYLGLKGTNATANRTITLPDATDTVALLGQSQTFTGNQTITGTLTPSGGFVLPWVTSGVFSLSQGGAVATSAFTGRYVLIGKLCILQVVAIVSGAGVALAAVQVNVPAAIQSRVAGMRLGVMEILDSGTAYYSGVCQASTATGFVGIASGTTGFLGNAGFTAALAAGDTISLALAYEIL